VFASRGTSLVPQAVLENAADPLLADFNSDGLTDIAWSRLGTYWRLLLATGRRGTTDAGFAIQSGGGMPALSTTAKPMVVDWDGDGRSDLLVPGTSEWLVCRSLGTMLETCKSSGMGPVGASGSPVVLDANGDGLTDFVHADPALRFRAHDAGAPDLLFSAVDGHGVRAEFEYATLTRADVHVVGRVSVHPVVDHVAPALIVSRLTKSDGVGGTFRLSYTYEGAKVHTLGRGFLGFARQSEMDSRGGTVTVTDYRQDPTAYEQIGAAAVISVLKSDGTPIGRTTHHWARLGFGSGYEARSYPYVASSLTDRYDLDGTWVSSNYTRNLVDSFGVTFYRHSRTSEVNGGLNPGAVHWERVSAASVMNDTANWCIGRVGTTQVTRGHSLPGGGEVTRTSSRTVDPVSCRTTQEIVEPGSADLQVTTDISYDAFGNLAYRTSNAAAQALRMTRYSWLSSGRFLQSVTNAEGHRSSMTWDPVQAVRTSATDPNGLVTQWQYDAFQRPVREVRPDGTRTELARAYCGSSCGTPTALHYVASIEQGAGGIPIRSSTVAYDVMDREVSRQAEQPGGAVMRITAYSDRGLPTRQSAPSWCCGPPASWITRTYDLLGRPLRTERPTSDEDPTPVVTLWSHSGLSVLQTDALGRVTVSRRDVRGNVLQAVDAGNADMDYEYDAFDNLVRVRDFRGNETVVSYDPRGRRTSISDVDAGTRTFQYTPFGDLKSETNARGQTTTLAYDRISRPTARQELEGTTTWTWGRSPAARNLGALQSVSSPGLQGTHTYDLLGRPSVQTVSAFGGTFVTQYSYDSASGRLDTLTYPSDSSATPLRVRHHYDRGQLVRVSDASDANTTFWRVDALDTLGEVAAETLGNGVRVDSDRDVVTQRLRTRTAGPGGGNSFQNLRFTWDVAGNLSSRQEGNLGVHEVFSYDSRDRLDFMTSSGGTYLDLGYDEIGNVTYKSDVGSYVYDATKKHAVVAAGANSYAYDANGVVVNASGTTISWASFDLPTRIAHPSGNYSTFDYGPDRARIRQVARSGSETIETIYAAGGLYERVTRNGATSQRTPRRRTHPRRRVGADHCLPARGPSRRRRWIYVGVGSAVVAGFEPAVRCAARGQLGRQGTDECGVESGAIDHATGLHGPGARGQPRRDPHERSRLRPGAGALLEPGSGSAGTV
jgi:YD repeat-containing protein